MNTIATKPFSTEVALLPPAWEVVLRLPTLWQTGMWFFGYVLLRFLTRLTVVGAENLHRVPRNKSLILVANHESDLDGVMLLSGCPPWHPRFPLYYVARARKDYVWTNRFRKLFYRGWFFWLIGAFPILSKTKDYATALYIHKQLLERKRTVAIFPEGGFGRGVIGRRKAHGGVTFLAESTDAVVVPVRIQGAERMTFWTLLTRAHTVTITYKEPLSAESITQHNRTVFTEDKFHAGAEYILDHVYAA